MAGDDSSKLKLFALFALWYAGNYYYNIYNKVALNEGGGKTGPHAYTIAAAQLGVGFVYAILTWLFTINPITMSRQMMPKLSVKDCVSVTGVAVWSAFSHLGSVLCMNAGSVAFGQIVKAAEPVFAALVNTVFYGKPPTFAKAMMLPVIVLGVAIACLKPDKDGNYKVDFEIVAVIAGSFANVSAAFKGSENARLMAEPGLKERIGSIGNQFALAQVFGFIVLIPIALVMEGAHLPAFFKLLQTNKAFAYNIFMSGLTFYGYNELSTMTIKHTGAVTQSVANTAKRVIVIVGVAIALGKPLTFEEKVGSAISISGVFLYSVADKLMGGSAKDADKKKK
mmetsp:Transcript_23095/g.59334  ORF Transcript_23095/g.59334 Transcript_23095/m.59334 type:complete len:338 (-) Transcript_23095:55-1068(-)